MASPVVVPTVTGWGRGLWAYYRHYTDTTIHTAATAALAIFGILVVVDAWFAAVAVASYLVPPVVLYVLSDEPAPDADPEPRPNAAADRPVDDATTVAESGRSSEAVTSASPQNAPIGGRDTDGDTDSDADDGDTDSDSDDGDTDSDSDGRDTDTDFDGRGTDTDSDSDG